MSSEEVELGAALEEMRVHIEVHNHLLAIAFGALAQQLRDPDAPENPTGFMDRIEHLFAVPQDNEYIEPYLKRFFELARRFALPETEQRE